MICSEVVQPKRYEGNCWEGTSHLVERTTVAANMLEHYGCEIINISYVLEPGPSRFPRSTVGIITYRI